MSRVEKLDSWHADWRELRVAVLGLGVTGFSVADTLAELGCAVTVFAETAEPDRLDLLNVLGVQHVTGTAAAGLPESLVQNRPELIVTSPGVRPDNEIIAWAKASGIPVWVDIDLAWRLRDKQGSPAAWLCVTGTNGKTTTVQLATHILNSAGIKAVACGNIGTPILDCIREPDGFDVLVVELSSFQLHYMGEIAAHSSAILNIDQDHIDWHGSFEEYRRVKGKVHHGTTHALIYNDADAATRELTETANSGFNSRAVGFTLAVPSPGQIGFVEDVLADRAFVTDPMRAADLGDMANIAKIGVLTPHLLANVAAASALVRSYGVSSKAVIDAVATFRLDAHRIEVVGEIDGVTYIDDSKATNPHAAAASLSSFESVVWVVGGLLKGVDITPLVVRFAKRLRGAVVIGKDRELVLEALAAAAPEVPVIEVDVDDNDLVMPMAVQSARMLAQAGDVVLLAPSAASMDQFKDYADRGKRFAAAVGQMGQSDE